MAFTIAMLLLAAISTAFTILRWYQDRHKPLPQRLKEPVNRVLGLMDLFREKAAELGCVPDRAWALQRVKEEPDRRKRAPSGGSLCRARNSRRAKAANPQRHRCGLHPYDCHVRGPERRQADDKGHAKVLGQDHRRAIGFAGAGVRGVGEVNVIYRGCNMPPVPTYQTCEGCRHWTRDSHSYVAGNCDLPENPATLPQWPQLPNWPRTDENEKCEHWEIRPISS